MLHGLNVPRELAMAKVTSAENEVCQRYLKAYNCQRKCSPLLHSSAQNALRKPNPRKSLFPLHNMCACRMKRNNIQ